MQKHTHIRDIPPALRPYEKCEQYGAGVLSDAELLAVLLRSGTKEKSALRLAEEILSLHDSENGLLNLMQYEPSVFRELKGIGRVKALQLSCISELSRRIWRSSRCRGEGITSPKRVADYYMEELRHADHELCYLMLLDNRSTLLKSILISQGTVNASAVSPREIFTKALMHRAASFILVHNHPSGDAVPSDADIRFTKLLYQAGQMMNLPLRDSVIIGDNVYLSFREQGLLPGLKEEGKTSG